MRFQGKVAVVTGAGTGIGLAIAQGFGQEGAQVALVDWNKDLTKPALEAMGAAKDAAIFVNADISNPEDVEGMVAQVKDQFGRLDILVNNAGIYLQADITKTSLADWERIMAVNLTGAFLCSKYAVLLLEKQAGGVIVNIASEAGLVGIRGQVAYNVSKAGLVALTRSCAVDLADRNIRVNCVCPGTTYTPLVEAALRRAPDPSAARRRLEECRPMNRLGTPSEIASAVLYLASEEAGYATGSILSIDGGYTAQ